MTFAGYLSKLRVSGIPTAMSTELMSTFSGSSTTGVGGTPAFVMEMNSTARQVWDRTLVPTFRIGSSVGSTISSTTVIDINYVFGRTTFNSTFAGGVVSVVGQYMPMAVAAGAHTYTLSQTADVLDDTDFTSTGFRSKNVGLFDVSLTLNSWEPLSTQFREILVASSTSARRGQPIVGEVNPGGSSLFARGWFVVENDSLSGDVSGLEEASISLQIDGNNEDDFRWSDQ